MNALKENNRRGVWFALARLKGQLAALEKHLQEKPDDIIPFVDINRLQVNVTDITWHAGQFNACKLSGKS